MASHAGLPQSGTGSVTPNGAGSNPATNPKMRKRTKTGCLTCRKRRIKCGEERPTCANCIKSKRQCEGYNQRVIFKAPIGEWPNHPGVVSTLQYHNSMLPGTRRYSSQTAPQPPDGSLPIQPRPVTQFDFADYPNPGHMLVGQYGQDPNYQQSLQSPHYQQPLHSPHHHQLPTPTSASGTSYFPSSSQPSPIHSTFQHQYASDGHNDYPGQQQHPQGGSHHHIPVSYDTHIDQKPPTSVSDTQLPSFSQAPQEQTYQQGHRATSMAEEQQSHYVLPSNAPPRTEEYPQHGDSRPDLTRTGSNPRVPQSQPSPVSLSQARSYALPPTLSHSESYRPSYQTFPVQIPQHDVSSDVKYVPQHAVLEQPVAVSQAQPALLMSGFAAHDHVSPTEDLVEAAVEHVDDDYYDVQSDEEMPDEVAAEMEETDEDTIMINRDLSLIQRLHHENINELAPRGYSNYIYAGILTHYRPEEVASPLKNPQTARVFAHFVGATGPSLSIYERNPRNPTSLFDGSAAPSQQSLWTYVLPMKALKHQGLLHAMLALSSLHIARLQNASITPSWTHYAYALKRLYRYLSDSKKRLQIQTLATSLLLAFYEVMTAEHVKWGTHLVGAALLLRELDFRSLAQQAQRLKSEKMEQEQRFPYQNPEMLIDQKQYQRKLIASAMGPDENLVSTIMGKQVTYDDFDRVEDEDRSQSSRRNSHAENFDLSNFETLQDLNWWYMRHDAFQSMVSGNPLIMDYRKWSDCPPRGPLARSDALYGTHDHLILLIGRITDFTVRDRERKLKQMEANGGQWRPTPGMPGMPMGPPQGQGQQGPVQTPTTPVTPMGPPQNTQGMGPPQGWTGPPPPGWTGGPLAPQTSGPPPGWIGPPPQGWPSGPPQMSPTGPPQGSSMMPPPPPPGQMPPPQSPGFMPPSYPGQSQMSGQPQESMPPSSQGPPQGHPSAQMPQTPQMGPPPNGPPPTSAMPSFYGMAPTRPPIPLPDSYANPDPNYHHSPKTPSTPHPKFADLPSAYASALEDWNSILHAHTTVSNILSSTPAFAPLPPELDFSAFNPGGSMTPFGPALVHRSHDISIIWTLVHLSHILLLRSHPAAPPAMMMAAQVCAPATAPIAQLIGRIAAGGLQMPTSDATPLNPSLGAALIESTMSLFFAGIQYREELQRTWLIKRLLDIDRRTGWASAGTIARSCETSWERVAELGRGPAYPKRRTRRFGEEGPVVLDEESGGEGEAPWGEKEKGGRGDGGGYPAMSDAERWDWIRRRDRFGEEEKRYVVRHPKGYTPWAMNLLGTDEDLRVGMEKVEIGPGM